MSDIAPLLPRAAAILDRLRADGLSLALAESCTGGLAAALFTEIPGSSDVFDRGFVTYSNAAKSDLLGVAPALIAEHGAVSEAVARAMAEGALARSAATVAVSVTGIAGPGGGSPAKPVGLVHFAISVKGLETGHRACRFGDRGRSAVRLASVATVLDLIEGALDQRAP